MHRRRRGDEEAARVRKWLQEASGRMAKVIASDAFRALRNFRDKYVAHSLTVTRREKAGPVLLPKYGWEKELR